AGAGSRTLSNLPLDGSTVYVRLSSWIGGSGGNWYDHDYTYTASSSGTAPSQITSPTNNSTFVSCTPTLSWDSGVGVTAHYLKVGTTVGGADLYDGYVAGSSAQIPAPGNGIAVHVRLMSYISGWVNRDYAYTAFTSSSATGSALTSPANGS